MKAADFASRYKALSTDSLLDILDHPGDYQPEALAAARQELEGRQLAPEQLATARAILDTRREAEALRQRRQKEIGRRARHALASVLELLNPKRDEAPATRWTILIISLFITGIFLFQAQKEWSLFVFMFSDERARWDFSMVLYFLPIAVLPPIILLFWFRKRIGWVLATLYGIYMALGAMLLLVIEWNRQPTGNPTLDALFPVTPPIVRIVTMLLFSGLLWALCRKSITAAYGITKKQMFLTLGIGSVGMLILLLML